MLGRGRMGKYKRGRIQGCNRFVFNLNPGSLESSPPFSVNLTNKPGPVYADGGIIPWWKIQARKKPMGMTMMTRTTA